MSQNKNVLLFSKEDIRMAVHRRGNQIARDMGDKDFFLSSQFQDYAEHLADYILRDHKLYSLELDFDEQDNAPVAYTDGKKIYLNCGNVVRKHGKVLEERFLINMGILFHEVGHKMFMDFSGHEKAAKAHEGGSLYASPKLHDTDLKKNLTELEATIAKPGYGPVFAELFHHFANIVQDGRDEGKMMETFPGFISNCIRAARKVSLQNTPTVEEIAGKSQAMLGLYQSMCLTYAKHGTVKTGAMTNAVKAAMDVFDGMIPFLDAALEAPTVKRMYESITGIILVLWPIIKTMLPDESKQSSQSNDSGSNGSQNGANGNNQGQNSMDALSKMLAEAISQAQQNTSSAPAPKNCSGSGQAKKLEKKEKEAAGNPQPQPPSNQQGAEALRSMINAIAQNQAEQQVQKELDDAEMDAIRNMKQPLIHNGVKLTVSRHTSANKAAYTACAKNTALPAKKLAEAMLRIMEEQNDSFVARHKQFGPILEATEAYRPDKAFFAKKKLPDNVPNMAMAVLIDQSGSMRGRKISYAQEAAIMLEQFARLLDIPLLIAGHNTARGKRNLYIYTDFLSTKPEKDRYTLGGIDTGGANRDGLSIRGCAELLAGRPEDIKLLVIISDGAPNDDGYSGEQANKDIRDTVAEFRRKGLIIYGAAIDKDAAVIEKLYGKGFLSIENLAAMPRTLVRLVKQHIT